MELRLDDGTTLHFRVDGPEGADWVVFSHSLGCDLHMWEPQCDFLVARGRRVLRYDIRGHGRSGLGATPYDLDRLASDLRALLDHLQVTQADLVGISLGGLVVQTLALQQPQRMRRLLLADTTARYPDAGRKMWGERAALVRAEGTAAILESTLQRWFGAGFSARAPAVFARASQVLLATDSAGYAGCCAALAQADTTAALQRLDGRRCLIVVGEHDLGTPLALSEALQAALPGSRLEVIADAAHLSSWEQPQAFNALMASFLLQNAAMSANDRFPPLPDSALDEAQRAAVAAISATPRGGVLGPFVPLLRSPELMDCVQRTGAYLRYRSALGTRLSELVILLVSRHWTQQVEWAIHGPIALAAGIDPATVDAIARGVRPDGMSEQEAAIYDVCAEMHTRRSLGDESFAAAQRLFGDQGVIDLLGLIGYYGLLAVVMNGARTAVPPSKMAPLPDIGLP